MALDCFTKPQRVVCVGDPAHRIPATSAGQSNFLGASSVRTCSTFRGRSISGCLYPATAVVVFRGRAFFSGSPSNIFFKDILSNS